MDLGKYQTGLCNNREIPSAILRTALCNNWYFYYTRNGVQLGISIADLDLLTIGLVNDMFTERQNDDYPYKELASQSDFDKF